MAMGSESVAGWPTRRDDREAKQATERCCTNGLLRW